MNFRIMHVYISWFDFESLSSSFDFFFALSGLSGLITGNMTGNQERLRHGRVSRHAFIHR